MANQNCGCGGNAFDNFYSMFVCNRASCEDCHTVNNECCNPCYNDNNNNSGCLDFYSIDFKNIISSKIKAFGYCDYYKALGIIFVDGTKKLILNVDKSIYDELIRLNTDPICTFLESNLTNDNYCINMP